eukprot:jgi/Tetstr1/428207/TSEL_018249.t1
MKAVAVAALALSAAGLGLLRALARRGKDVRLPRSPHATRSWALWAAQILSTARSSSKKIASATLLKINTEGDALMCQDAMIERPGALGALVGWKCGATTADAQAALGIDEPFAAPLFSKYTYAAEAPEVLDLGYKQTPSRKVEAEIGFRLGRSLPKRRRAYTEVEVWAAVAEVLPVVEFVHGRIEAGQNTLTIMADGGINAATVHGKPRTQADADCSTSMCDEHVRLTVNKKVMAEGTGELAYGSPLRALTWLANHLITRGHCLQAGQLVITGAIASCDISPGDTVAALYDTLGSVEVNMVAKLWEA